MGNKSRNLVNKNRLNNENMGFDNITHINVNTGDRAVYKGEGMVIPSKAKSILEEKIEKALTGKPVEIIDGVKVRINIIDKYTYSADLFADEGLWLRHMVGTLKSDIGKRLIKNYGSIPDIFNLNVKGVEAPSGPMILDALSPLAKIRPDVSLWAADFSRCLGIIMFEKFVEKHRTGEIV